MRCVLWLLVVLGLHCHVGVHDPGLGDGRERFSVYYSEPGRDMFTMVDKKVDEELIRLIDNAQRYVYLAVYNFNKTSVVQAVLRAFQRNLDVRVVGDIDEFYTSGYQAMFFNNINMTLGNSSGIQHNKFAVVDDRFVFTGTGNISETDMVRNNNNWYIIENPDVVRIYKEEFLQMHNGLFASQKRQRSVNTTTVVNNYPLEIYFSPYQGNEAMDRIIELVESATQSIHYMIFAYTHDELDAAMVKMARQKGIPVYGIHDSTFVTGVSEEAPKLYSAIFNNDGSLHPTGPFVRWDGNENTSVKNNPAHGGKMHCKTVLIDAGTEKAKMATGSFNWSNNAINNNDENVIIVHQPRVVNTIYRQWQDAWGIANDMALRVTPRGHIANPGDVVITEIGWAGSTDGSSIKGNDDFIEILNNTGQPIDLSHWAIQWGPNDKRNLYPVPDNHNWYYENKNSCAGYLGYLSPQPNIICPGQIRIFFVPKPNNAPSAFAEVGADEIITYNEDGAEIRSSTGGSLSTEHFPIAGTKNFRLNRGRFRVRLYDKAMNLIDEAGNGDAAFAGELADYNSPKQTFSLERRGCTAAPWPCTWPSCPRCQGYLPGNLPSAWFTHPLGQPYNCSSRQDYSVSNPIDACLERAANTFSSAGYIYSSEADPQIVRAEAISANQIRVTFDSNVSGALAPNNCLTAGSLSISETYDPGNLCSAPTISTLSAGSNSSQVIATLSAAAMASPTCRYQISAAASCHDYGNRSASGSSIHFNGYTPTLATAILNEICVTDCPSGTFNGKDWVEIKTTSAGSLRGLKVYYYDDSDLRLLYEFHDVYAPANAIVAIGVAQASFARPDRTSGSPSFPMVIQLRDTEGFTATDGTFILTYCATGENDVVDNNQPGCNLPKKGIQDAVYYSNRDSSIASGMVAGALQHFYTSLKSFWPIAERPVSGLNDRQTQLTAACIAADSSAFENATYFCSNSGAGIARSGSDMGGVQNPAKAAWRNFPKAQLSPAAPNTAW
ncbi:MAG: phospholipase D-like domain-containing protein [Leptospiraceae bacterium]|nr:phospholipase D-like domain-containing protein [Leptospiraceae bacterium]